MMKRTIWFDMDGTIADLYSVENWLPKLRAYDPSPYAEAEVIWNMSLLARYLNKLQKLGYRIGIISWLSKSSNIQYDEAVTKAKREWLKLHLNSVTFDLIHITPYGVPKELWMTNTDDILFDDSEEIRNEWDGEAYEPTEIFSVLSSLIKGE
jgi:hypothetical protein